MVTTLLPPISMMPCDHHEHVESCPCPEQQPSPAQRRLREEIEGRYGIRPGIADILFYKENGYLPFDATVDHVGEPD